MFGCGKCLFNVSIILVLVAVGGMYVITIIVDKLSEGTYIGQHNLGFLFSLFVLMFLIFYTILLITAVTKYTVKKKLCSATNFKIFILSWLLFYPLSERVVQLNDEIKEMEELLKPTAENCSLRKSPLSILNQVTNDGYKLLCSEECPCNGNPEMFRDDPLIEVIAVSKNEKCSNSPNKRCLYFDFKAEMFNAQKCYNKRWANEKTAGMPSSKQDNYDSLTMILKDLEENNQCSGGLCDGDAEGSFLPIYVFSNINNGIPTKSCHESIENLVMSNMESYLLGFIVPLCEAVLVTLTYTFIILSKIWRKCCHDKKKKKKDKKNRQRREMQVSNPEVEIELELDQQEQVDSMDTDDNSSASKHRKHYKQAVQSATEDSEASHREEASASPSSFPPKEGNAKKKQNQAEYIDV